MRAILHTQCLNFIYKQTLISFFGINIGFLHDFYRIFLNKGLSWSFQATILVRLIILSVITYFSAKPHNRECAISETIRSFKTDFVMLINIINLFHAAVCSMLKIITLQFSNVLILISLMFVHVEYLSVAFVIVASTDEIQFKFLLQFFLFQLVPISFLIAIFIAVIIW